MAFKRLRTIGGQLIASLLLFECVALLSFSALLLHEMNNEAQQRTMRRLEYQARELEVVIRLAIRDRNASMLQTVVASMLQFPTIEDVKVSDANGVLLANADRHQHASLALTANERQMMERAHGLTLLTQQGAHLAVLPVDLDGQRVACIWIYPNEGGARANIRELLRVSAAGVFVVLLACTLLAALIARSLTAPLTRLLAGTRAIIHNPNDTSAFPLPVTSSNEVADLTAAFNLMVASIEEQRTGLNDTLSLLDSMLANAPVGIAFFDRNTRFVRVNQYLAGSHPHGIAHFLGRKVDEIFAPEAAAALDAVIAQVFAEGRPMQGLELAQLRLAEPEDGTEPAAGGSRAQAQTRVESQTWIANAYPVRTAGQLTRWTGVVFIDITERLRAEHALRETEKLAVTGRLSASIAHEINNPLEAVTNLLYLIRMHGELKEEAAGWADAAQHELARVSEIAQQTLRFYRQSTRREVAGLPELLDAVLTLYQGRVTTLQVQLERRYRDAGELLCFGGELRQLFANLLGNALDAMQPQGGRLVVAVRGSRLWSAPGVRGVRVTVADTGCGMSPAVRARIFEPFYTTKEATGTGLGLWVSAEIMAKHGVALRIRSRERSAEPGARSGTVFMLFFPEGEPTAETPVLLEGAAAAMPA